MSFAVFVAFLVASLAIALTARRVVAEQENKLLTQRAAEAAALITNAVSATETSIRALSTVTQATGEDPVAYQRAAAGTRPNLDVALVKPDGGRFRVLAAKGDGLSPDSPLRPEALDVLRRAGTVDQIVTSPVFRTGEQRRVGFAIRTGDAPDSALVYGETILSPPGQRRQLTSTRPFSEIEAVVYAGSRADPDQVVLATRPLPLDGPTVEDSFPVGAEQWLVVVAANRSLVGSLARHQPGMLLGGGLLATVLVTALVEVLLRRRGYALALVERQTEQLRERTEDLAHVALHDTLTGLPNRVLLADRLEQALGRTTRIKSSVAVLFIDLDRFKFVNDSRGHAVGDELLVAVADRLRRVVRTADTVARFGGDEFVVVCEDQDAAVEASLVADRIANVLREPFLAGGHEVFLGASIGIAMAGAGTDPPTDSATDSATDSPESLIRDADAAMYRAKENGRDRSEFFDAVMRTEAVERFETQSALHRAVQRDELRLHYQPVVDLASSEVVGVEALVRWDRPHHGLVGPGAFIPLAEETGLIVPIGRWVLEEAARQVARWHAARPGRPLTVSVNLSAAQLRQPDLVPSLTEILAANGINPASLCLELTESTFMEDADGHRAALAAIRAAGVSLVIDDFGTGFSSLTYLKRFPVNALKIDQAFVAGLGRDSADTAIVKSVIDLAHALGLTVVAEGVETLEQADHLRRLGCDMAQGYHFARPLPAADLDVLLGLRDHLEATASGGDASVARRSTSSRPGSEVGA